MNNKEVYINGVLCDLDETNNPIQLVYAINDLAELKDRQAYSTNAFKLPPTQNNLTACGFPNNANLIQEPAYRKNTAKIVQGGIEVLPNGIAIINKTSKDIEVQILSGLIGFFDQLGDKNIRDLDLSNFDHFWNLGTVANSQTNEYGFIYPVIDYGDISETERSADVRKLRPATFRKTIIEAIISEAGYTASGSYTSYDKYNRSIVAFSNDTFNHGPGYSDLINGYKMSARKTVDEGVFPNVTERLVVFQDDSTTDPYDLWNFNKDGYVSPLAMKVSVVVKYTITQRNMPLVNNPREIYMILQRSYNGGSTWIDEVTNQTLSNGMTEQTFYDQQLEAVLDVAPGHFIRVVLKKAVNRSYCIIHQGASISINPIKEDVIYGSEIQLASTLPDISQKNFFKDFLQNFGLIVIPDNYKKELLLINMEDVYANKPIADDITDRLIDSQDNVSYSLTGYGINNYGKYKDDDGVVDGLGDGVMVFDNLTLNDSVTLFTSVFAATETAIKLGGIPIPQINKGTDFKTKTQPRILLNKLFNSSLDFFDGAGSQSVQMISAPVFAGLDYQTLFDENYPEIKRMLFRPFVVTKLILLKEIHIANIDWRIPVYDKKSSSYYYKNQITYMQGDVSTISLIKLP